MSYASRNLCRRVVLLAMIVSGVTTTLADDQWDADLATWIQKRDQTLRDSNGWLAVSALHYLQDGEFSIGGGKDCDIHVPGQSVPQLIGRLTVSGSEAMLTCSEGVSIRCNEKPTTAARLTLASDAAEADGADLITVGTATIFLIRRAGLPALRMKDSMNPLLRSFAGEQRFAPDRRFVTTAHFTPAAPDLFQTISNIRGDSLQVPVAGTLDFELKGKRCRLTATPESDGRLFIVFRDQTTGHETYSGGRFLLTTVPDEGKVVLDFNRAVNPPCAWNQWTTCPLPAAGNTLPVAVRAGALVPKKSVP